jgi:hypothetical protein
VVFLGYPRGVRGAEGGRLLVRLIISNIIQTIGEGCLFFFYWDEDAQPVLQKD